MMQWGKLKFLLHVVLLPSAEIRRSIGNNQPVRRRFLALIFTLLYALNLFLLCWNKKKSSQNIKQTLMSLYVEELGVPLIDPKEQSHTPEKKTLTP